MARTNSTPESIVIAFAERQAQELCAGGEVNPDVARSVFQIIRDDERQRQNYLKAAGCETGFETGHRGKTRLNKLLGARIKLAIGGEDDEEAEVPADAEEFIRSYMRYRRRPVRFPR